MATSAAHADDQNIKDLLKIYDTKILPIGITAKGYTDEIVDIVSNYCWTAQQFDQRNTETNKVTYSHNIPFCYAIEREQTIGSGAANILNTILGNSQALVGVGTQAANEIVKALGYSGLQMPINVKETGGSRQEQARATTPTPTPSAIRSNTFPNIIMPTPGNGQLQQGNNNGIAPIVGGIPGTPWPGVVDGTLGPVNTKTPTDSEPVSTVSYLNSDQRDELANAFPIRENDTGTTATSSNGSSDGSGENQGSSLAALAKAFESKSNTILNALKVLGDDFAEKTSGRLAESNLNESIFLKPWKWLYFTKQTSKKFVFPMLKANDLHKLTNQWGNGESAGRFAGFFDIIGDWLKTGGEIAKGVRDFAFFFPKAGEAVSYENLEVEKAMGYQYSTNGGPDAKVEFVLFNTTKKDAWKKNFRFILLFALRNMPFRTSIYAYKTPLLYDIIIPGVKHLPMCYVASFDITALGHVRNMTADNIVAEIADKAVSSTTLVPVPEAWQIGITFKCMIPNTSNLVLNLASFPINVTLKGENRTRNVQGVDNPADWTNYAKGNTANISPSAGGGTALV